MALFESVLARRLHASSELNLDSWRLAAKLIEVSGPERAYEILSTGDYPGKMLWLSAYFIHLPPEAVTTEGLGRLYELYETASWRDLQRGVGYLLKYETVDPAVVIKVTRALVTRATDEPDFGLVLSDLFSGGPELEDHLRKIFAGEVELLKRAYLAACAAETHTDYDGASFNILLDLDHNFAREWVANMFAGKSWVSRHDDSRDYTFLWQRDDHREVAEQIVDAVHVEGRGLFYSSSYLRTFFTLREGAENVQELWDRQDAFFDAMIAERHSDHDYIQTLLAVICNLSPERRRGCIATFLHYNQDFDAFNALPLEPTEAAWSGSAVPMLQGQVDYLESLLPLVSSVELLRHRQKIEYMIQNLREDIEREKKRDFMRDRW